MQLARRLKVLTRYYAAPDTILYRLIPVVMTHCRFFFFFFFFFFFGHPAVDGVPGPGIRSKLQFPPMPQLAGYFNPLSWSRDQICILVLQRCCPYQGARVGTSILTFLKTQSEKMKRKRPRSCIHKTTG